MLCEDSKEVFILCEDSKEVFILCEDSKEGRTGCQFENSGSGTCATAECGSGEVNYNGVGAFPSVTPAEFTLGTASMDYYDVSLVDDYNLSMMVAARGRSGSCATTMCGEDLNRRCPLELRVEYCCNDVFGNPSTCKPSTYSEIFKSVCPKAYSYAYNDATSTFTCPGANYTITFCPSSPSLKSSTYSSPKGTNSGSGSVTGTSSSVEQSELATSWLADMATTTGASTRARSFVTLLN
ncbi:hypothetical protein VIGAN_06108500 [Vigna angularis var. angularis]|uniref:Thaumatin-like protein n=1 Tax=Vigna angularis var. angularis TaxID=157739 RepID=A0A0S3SB14_PHAAN|nr:hypothetical protein VIGAN_06108500 [Vigna angularis var. angularis]